MTDTPGDVLNLIRDNEVQIVDLRFADLPGLMQHFSVPAHELTEEGFDEGFGFDGSLGPPRAVPFDFARGA